MAPSPKKQVEHRATGCSLSTWISALRQRVTPAPRDDHEAMQTQGILRNSIKAGAIGWTVTCIIDPSYSKLCFGSFTLLMLGFFWNSLNSGKVDRVRIGLPVLFSAGLCAIMTFYAGLHDATNTILLMPLAVAQSVLGGAGIMVVWGVTAAGIAIMFFLDYSGLFPPPVPQLGPQDLAQSLALLSVGTFILHYFHTVRLHNIHARIRAERVAELVEENSVDTIWICNRDLEITYCSPAVRRLLGVEASEILGMNVMNFSLAGQLEPGSRDISDLFKSSGPLPSNDSASQRFTHQLTFQGQQGKWVETIMSLARDLDSEEICVLGVTRDITERKQEDAEREQIQIRLGKAEHLERLGLIAGRLAHDFNNLLVRIVGRSELLAGDEALNEETRREAELIRDAAMQGSQLCRNLLISVGRGGAVKTLIDAGRALEGVHLISRLSLRPDVEITIKPSDVSLPLLVECTVLQQVLMNLLVNSLDAIEKDGHVSISVARETLDRQPQDSYCTPRYEEFQRGDYAVFVVGDSGSGISEADIPRIFEPFYTTKSSGTGLGLSGASGFAAEHRGFLQVISKLAVGTKIGLYLPLVAGETTAPEASQHTISLERPDVPARNLRIMLVDDDDDVRNVTALILERTGFEVIPHASPEKALKDIENMEECPDLLLSDMSMPGMDGLTLCQLVRMRRPLLPFIIYSGYGESDQLQDFRPDDRSVLLRKPYRSAELLSAIESLRQRTPHRPDLASIDGPAPAKARHCYPESVDTD